MSDWLITYKPPGSYAGHDVWALITGVPSKTTRADVMAALEVWPRWSQWQARVRVGGRVGVRLARIPDRPVKADMIAWEDLAPDSKRISVDVPGELYAAVSRGAQAAGVSLAEWVRSALDRAVAEVPEGSW